MTEIVGRSDHTATLAEAARLLGMSISTARRAEKAGTFPLPILRTKSWVRVLRRDLDAYLGSPPQPQPVESPTADLLTRARIAGLRAELAVLEAEELPPLSLPEVRRERKLRA
jgi:transcriptional regulator with XRE-family HTH domain